MTLHNGVVRFYSQNSSGSATTSPSIPDEFRQRFPVDHPVAPFTRQVQPNSPCGPLQSSAAPADTVPDSHLKAGITKIMKNIIFFTWTLDGHVKVMFLLWVLLMRNWENAIWRLCSEQFQRIGWIPIRRLCEGCVGWGTFIVTYTIVSHTYMYRQWSHHTSTYVVLLSLFVFLCNPLQHQIGMCATHRTWPRCTAHVY